MSNMEKPQHTVAQEIYEWHERKEEKKPLRLGRLGSSQIGKPCDRALWYSFRKLFAVKFEGRILRLFQTGHLEEPRMVEELRGIGCRVEEIDERTGNQFEFSALGGHFVCYPDGAALGLSAAPKTWHILEFKTINTKGFKKLVKDEVRKSKPEHYAQMMVGMGMAPMTRAFYLVKNKDTDELYDERIKFVKADFDRIMARAKTIISATNPLERCATRPDDFRCKFCDAYKLCWATGEASLQLPSKTCRSCCHATPEIDDTDNAHWSCKALGKDLTREEQLVACDKHLILPGLISFAEPIDAGDDWIRFKNNRDGVEWVHGHKDGMWSTNELLKTPGSLVGEKEVQDVKEAFGGTVVNVEETK